MSYNDILEDLRDGRNQFPAYCPYLEFALTSDGKLFNGPEVVWYSNDNLSKSSAFGWLEVICTDIIAHVGESEFETGCGWKKIPGFGGPVIGSGARYNNAGRVALWALRSQAFLSDDARNFRIKSESPNHHHNGTHFKMVPSVSLFVILRATIKRWKAGSIPKTEGLTVDEQAIAVLAANPRITKGKIAERLGINPRQLQPSRASSAFNLAWEAATSKEGMVGIKIDGATDAAIDTDLQSL